MTGARPAAVRECKRWRKTSPIRRATASRTIFQERLAKLEKLVAKLFTENSAEGSVGQ
jgi:hypothetical protein